jgi:hypothetical protein
LNNLNDSLKSSPRFDWMQTTVHEDAKEIFDTLEGTLGADLEAGRGLNGYERSMVVKRKGETLAKVFYGGFNGWPNVLASGAATDDVVPVVRAAWPVHEVTRMDSAQDFSCAGGYELLRDQLVTIHEKVGLSKREIESVVNGVRSRTIYLGSPSSRVQVRLYEKGMFEHQLGNASADSSWFRLEAQIRPTGPARARAAELDPSEAWGCSSWTRELALVVMGLQVERVTMQLKREPDYMRAIRALEQQYSATLKKALAVEGSWDAVGRLLGVLA